MAKTEQTLNLEKQLYHTVIKRVVFGTFEVTLGWYGKERVDFMTYDYKGVFRCYEIKVSVSDFHSKAKKSFVGDFNYYVMPYRLWKKVKDEIPKGIGVYVSSEEQSPFYYIQGENGDCKKYWLLLTLVKKPKRQAVSFDKEVLYSSMIRCLHRDAEKYNKLSEDLSCIEKIEKDYQSQLREKDRAIQSMNRQYGDLLTDLRKIYGNDFVREFHKKRMELE